MGVRHPEVHSANPKEESAPSKHLKTEKNGLTNYRYEILVTSARRRQTSLFNEWLLSRNPILLIRRSN